MNALAVHVDGVGLWSPQLGSFAALRAILGGTPVPPPARPAAALLPAGERRRAPESVLLAVEVASQAVTMSGCNPAGLPCVFASSHGDQAIMDYMCATLAATPAELSPTRFHNSVHNAPAGYWTIATGCHASSSAVCAQRASFGAGLLEAASLALADARPVLLVCSDTAGSGPLAEVTGSPSPFGCAMVLSPQPGASTLGRLALHLCPGSIADAPAASAVPADWVAASPSASALPLLALLAQGAGRCRVMAAGSLGMDIHLEECA
ncbi:beta-ketoacyl synthase chain length factor [Frateuria terrea]|uniref:Beta-ketoacyl synthase, N-terminal domain n=1 Tax=Frateuria terrea TaxID=529704 RepID=A0A1H6X6Q0_9GAMM|nr:beta-ketoacyl synthase chain length factor [Frateuria terrea]SEJ24748.1 Beta-ketoacyl synthase, N-terminal domain [Frateuria terrea]SFP59626.1 Beta-ketoacyl synthase, N-terminal domain [Frateuria terrea]